jgi:hypothetical protein
VLVNEKEDKPERNWKMQRTLGQEVDNLGFLDLRTYDYCHERTSDTEEMMHKQT